MKPVALVRNELADTFGVVPKELEGAGVPVVRINAFEGEPLLPASEVSGVIVFGGSQHADQTDAHPYLEAERQLLATAVAHETPALGICLGAQLLAMASGASLRMAPAKEFGFTPLSITAEGRRDELIAVYDEGTRVFHWHEDTFDLPPGAALLATGDVVTNQAFRVGRRAWGVQFHCEVEPQLIDDWLKAAGETFLRAWGKTSEEIREEVDRYNGAQEARSRELIRRFARVVQSPG